MTGSGCKKPNAEVAKVSQRAQRVPWRSLGLTLWPCVRFLQKGCHCHWLFGTALPGETKCCSAIVLVLEIDSEEEIDRRDLDSATQNCDLADRPCSGRVIRLNPTACQRKSIAIQVKSPAHFVIASVFLEMQADQRSEFRLSDCDRVLQTSLPTPHTHKFCFTRH